MTYVLGINAVYHESAACLLQDGKIVAMVEEERFNRAKHGKKPRWDNPDEFPLSAMRYCLDEAGITLADIAHIGYSSNPEAVASLGDTPDSPMGVFADSISRVPDVLRGMGFRGRYHWVDHHAAHAASGFFGSEYPDAAILAIDGIGDASSTSMYYGRGHQLKLVQQIPSPHSIGFLWELVSMYLGFDIYDATKIMGLAAYGDPERYYGAFAKIIQLKSRGAFEVDQEITRFAELDYLTPSGYFDGLEKLFDMPRRKRGQNLDQAYQDVSAALQQVTDEAILHMVRFLHEETGSRNLCLAGGVALNCVTNQRAFEESSFENLYVQPVAHDAGTAIGAAQYIWHHTLGNTARHAMPTAYLGPSFSDEQIVQALEAKELRYRRSDNIAQEVAALLAGDNIVGWFQGRMEAGPRALGNRSLLANPRNPNMREILNHKVKHREYFRPFAPSVLHEEAHLWFDMKKRTPASEFMLMAYPVPQQQRAKIPAVLHCDGTGRIQSVRKESNPRYHSLISEFNKLTGIPIVLNTSFNDSEPIVCSPQDAIHTFLKTKIDYLAIGDFLVSKAENSTVMPTPPPAPTGPWSTVTPALQGALEGMLADKRITHFAGATIVTDRYQAEKSGAVAPLFAEHQLFVDELPPGRVEGAEVLDVGTASGVLAIAAAKLGAKRVTALERDSRAKLLAGFNILLSGAEDRIRLFDTDDRLYSPVAQEQYDVVLCNAPVSAQMKAAVDMPSDGRATIYGMTFVERVLQGLDKHLRDDGFAQIVTAAPGTVETPTVLVALANRLLSGRAVVKVNPASVSYAELVSWMRDSGAITAQHAARLRLACAQDGVTHLHLCLLQYTRGQHEVAIERLQQAYPNWHVPLAGFQIGSPPIAAKPSKDFDD